MHGRALAGERKTPKEPWRVLEHHDLDGHCVLADILHTQLNTAELILDRAGNHIFVVTGDQPGQLAPLQAYAWVFC